VAIDPIPVEMRPILEKEIDEEIKGIRGVIANKYGVPLDTVTDKFLTAAAEEELSLTPKILDAIDKNVSVDEVRENSRAKFLERFHIDALSPQ